MNNTPQLRFPGFTGEWSESKLGNYFQLCNGYAFKSDDYVPNGKYRIVTISNVKNGQLDVTDSNAIDFLPANINDYQILKEGDIILSMTGNVGRVCVVNKTNCLLNQRVGLLKAKTEELCKKYFYSLLNSSLFESSMILCGQGAAQANISKENIESFKLFVPTDPAEQQKIAECLSALNDLISAQGEKVDALKTRKKGLMQQLFPQNGETTPRLRFPGFTGEWSERKLGQISSKIYRRNNLMEIKRVLTNSANNGIVDQNEYFDRDIAVKENTGNYYVVELGDFVYNPRISTAAPVGPISLNKIGVGIMSPLYTVFHIDNGYIPFFDYYFQTNIWHPYLKSIANFGARFDRMNITNEGFFNMPLYIPSPAEQQKIASCLSALDDLIASESAELEALKAHKKGLMQQLFPEPAK